MNQTLQDTFKVGVRPSCEKLIVDALSSVQVDLKQWAVHLQLNVLYSQHVQLALEACTAVSKAGYSFSTDSLQAGLVSRTQDSIYTVIHSLSVCIRKESTILRHFARHNGKRLK